jgi:hypothetical protein
MIPENNITISWQLPASDGGDAVTAYRIKFFDSAGTAAYEYSGCDGSDPVVV